MTKGFPALLREVKKMGYLAIIVTNQRGVGKGVMSQADLDKIHEALQDKLRESVGDSFDDIYFCTDPDRENSERRKPSPAMLLEAAAKWDIDLGNSWMIGDSDSDIEAGKRAGTKTAYLVTIHTEHIPEADHVLRNIDELIPLL